MNPTVYELIELFADPDIQEVAIFDLNHSADLYRGRRDGIPDELRKLEVCSIDNLECTKVLTLNVWKHN